MHASKSNDRKPYSNFNITGYAGVTFTNNFWPKRIEVLHQKISFRFFRQKQKLLQMEKRSV